MATFKIPATRVTEKQHVYSVRLNVRKYVQLPKSQLTDVRKGKMIVIRDNEEIRLECYIFDLKNWLFNKLEVDLKRLDNNYKLISR